MAFTHGPSITHQEALTHFLELGPNRTLPQLAEALAAMPGIEKAPSINCLKKWSRTHKWTAEAERYDADVRAKTHEGLVARGAERNIRWAAEFAKTGHEVLNRVRAEAAKIEVKTPQDLATLANVAVMCAREADALEGAKPQEVPPPAEAEASNVTAGPFSGQPAEPTTTQKLLAKLDAAIGTSGPPN